MLVASGVAQPQLDVRRRVEHLALHDERVAAGIEPLRQPVVPGPVPGDHPVGQDLAPPAVGEVRRCTTHDLLDHPVAGQARVAVDESLVRRGRDHERRVGGDQVEQLTGDRRPERAGADVDADVVERRVEGGDGQRARVDVGGDHLVGVAAQMQGLHPAAGAEVQRPRDRVADGELRQRRRCRADSQHVVGGDADRLAVETGREVADHPPVAVVVGVRAAVEEGAHLAARGDQHPAPDERVDEAGQRLVRVGPVDVGLEQEQPDQGLER